MKPKGLGQIFWIIIPLFAKKITYARPFLIYGVDEVDYILVKITNSERDYLNQFEFFPAKKPTTLYNKDKKSFVDPNILIYIRHDLFAHKLDETTRLKGQGEYMKRISTT